MCHTRLYKTSFALCKPIIVFDQTLVGIETDVHTQEIVAAFSHDPEPGLLQPLWGGNDHPGLARGVNQKKKKKKLGVQMPVSNKKNRTRETTRTTNRMK